MLKKNAVFSLTADALTLEGMGVCRHNGMVVFVPDMLPGETADVAIIKTTKRYAVGKLRARTTQAPARVDAPCRVFAQCGGCTFLHLAYAEQLRAKTAHVSSCLKKFSGTDISPLDTRPSPQTLHYRNKIAMPLAYGDGLQIGCFAKRSHRVVDTKECLLAKPDFTPILAFLRQWIVSRNICVYDETQHKGLLRRLILRQTSLGEIMLGIVINGESLPHADALIGELTSAFPACKSIVLNRNTQRGNVILGDTSRTLWGSPQIREDILGRQFLISLHTFLQVNHAQMEALYTYVLSLLPQPGGIVADLYCGAGTIALCAASHCTRIYGIEIVPQAILDARRNAALNQIHNAQFFCGDCAQAFASILEREPRLDAVIVDPPRKGLSQDVISHIAHSGASRVIYVSCDPATLSRDIKRFTQCGYFPLSVQPFDMFPQTGHVETVTLLLKADSQLM